MAQQYPPTHQLHCETLKIKQRELRHNFPLPLALRVHRALSWLRRANAEGTDLDVRFILLWIGFNAAYAGDLGRALEGGENPGSERDRFEEFFATLVEMDGENRIYDVIWQRFSQEIRMLLDNRYVFAPFWKFQSGQFGGSGWEIRFDAAKRAANEALASRNTPLVLSILFDRLYVLRTSLFTGAQHGAVRQTGVKFATELHCFSAYFRFLST
jgi:hypothetical protein